MLDCFDYDDTCDYLTPDEFQELDKDDSLSILQLNVRGISNKKDGLANLLNSCNIDVTIVNETWLKENDRFQIQNYKFVGKARPNKKGGGVGFLLRSDLKFRTRDDLYIKNKKVLLRERKRHTARHVVSTPSVVLPGYPPQGGYPDLGTPPPPGGGGVPGPRYPPGGLPRPQYSPPGGVPRPQPPPGGVPRPRYPPPGGEGTQTSVPPPGGVPGPRYPPPRGVGYLDLSTPPGGGYPDLGTPPGVDRQTK